MEYNGIPEKDIQELINYLGEKEAYDYIEKRKYNYQAVATKLFLLGLKSYLKRKPLIYTIIVIVIVGVLLLLIYEDLLFF